MTSTALIDAQIRGFRTSNHAYWLTMANRRGAWITCSQTIGG